MESLLVGVKQQELKLDVPAECEPAASEHGSVMLGEISPHHHSNHDDSKSSSETPPTYNQLNYFENLNRFFNSVHPIFVPNEFKSLPYQIDHVPTNEKDRMLSPIQQGGEECGGSFNSSSGDSPQFDSTNTSNTSNNERTIQPHLLLTEATVSRHTDAMECQMVKNHKRYRMRGSHMADKKKAPDMAYVHPITRNQPLKRSWPNDMTKHSKSYNQNEHRYTSNMGDNAQINKPIAQSEPGKTNGRTEPSSSHAMGSGSKAVHLWPPFSVNAQTIQNNIPPTNTIPNPINQFLLSKQLPTPRYCMSSMNPNGLLKMNPVIFLQRIYRMKQFLLIRFAKSNILQKLSDHTTQNVNLQPNMAAATVPNPYALHYLKSLMCQPRPFLGPNMAHPYPPIAYQSFPMLQQVCTILTFNCANDISLFNWLELFRSSKIILNY